MGMYTELVLSIELNEDVPSEVINTLKFMMNRYSDEDHVTPPDHKLFKVSNRWRYMLNSWSYYFDGFSNSALQYDSIINSYFLVIKCNLKNYENEIELFLDWIKGYSKTSGFVGYSRYEEDTEPTLIYF
ncbi:hypothetical protein [Lysinibacillus sp. FSL K6-0102]|uniref:hypothetical protein n=1 Tax=Lysinibacillus sp. FSL K6-0102 TaxID=2975290 RepID=UPI0030FB7850